MYLILTLPVADWQGLAKMGLPVMALMMFKSRKAR